MPEVKVFSETAGTVYEIVAAAGQTVAGGDELLLLEAMKMEIPVTAPAGGTVKRICVEAGATVAEGDLVAVLEA